ncbi:MAG TPA: hypothetical protein ENJ31_00310 [Anaerolineae bacterium]|nr:hypothetical protein [Anaerolineae bacterium]
MPSKSRKRLVIDASVARAAGGAEAVDPTSRRCRDFLLAVYKVCHRVVITPAIDREWKRHQSRFARKWRRWMDGQKKVIHPDPAPSYDALYTSVERTAANVKDREAMYKDFCLIEAAMATDRIVVSRDDEARDAFAKASASVGELRTLVWVNPATVEEQEAILWLEQGAPAERSRQLGVWGEE